MSKAANENEPAIKKVLQTQRSMTQNGYDTPTTHDSCIQKTTSTLITTFDQWLRHRESADRSYAVCWFCVVFFCFFTICLLLHLFFQFSKNNCFVVCAFLHRGELFSGRPLYFPGGLLIFYIFRGASLFSIYVFFPGAFLGCALHTH